MCEYRLFKCPSLSMYLSIYFVYLFCLSILSIYFVYLFCLSILSIYFVYLFCLSILSIYFFYLFCLSIYSISNLSICQLMPLHTQNSLFVCLYLTHTRTFTLCLSCIRTHAHTHKHICCENVIEFSYRFSRNSKIRPCELCRRVWFYQTGRQRS